jgi:SAM-dependent methyltransferase
MLNPETYDHASDYADIFDLRGKLYHQAMQAYPDSRSEEFLNVIAQADITPGMTVVDVPSGGAYLADYLTDVNLIGLETSQAFAELAKGRTESVLMYENHCFPLQQASADRVVSIAGLHHVQDKQPVFAEACRVLKPEGRLVVADAEEDSAVRRFLDEFVGAYCETGHSGWYFGDTTRDELRNAGLNIVADCVLTYAWHAPDKEQLADFCRTLFGMVRADNATVTEGIGDYLGFVDHPLGIGLNWQLQCFTCRPQHGQDT